MYAVVRTTTSWLFVVLLFVSIATRCEAADCTLSDYTAEYTICKPDGTHNLVWYKNQGSTCTGGVPLPDPTFGISCDINCDDGYYLPLGSVNCSQCAPGSYSRGGSVYVDNWESWPAEFIGLTTYCTDHGSITPNCSGWELAGSIIRSGNITDYQSSYLEFSVYLVVAGHIHFTYFVDAEDGWDGLKFYLDDVYTLTLVSTTHGQFVEFVTDLTFGFHKIQFIYYKDVSRSVGLDSAFIQLIDVAGVRYPDIDCLLCGVGEHSSGYGSTNCDRCPVNTYSNSTGTVNCTSCGPNEYAFPGDNQCSPKKPCTTSDYEILATACHAGNQRELVASWLQPVICDTSAITLPAPQTVSCAACNPGYARDASSFVCDVCPDGSASNGVGACQSCPAGTAAPKVFSLTSFDNWLDIETTGCDGDCATDGWRLRSSYIDSGVGHGSQVSSWFSVQVSLTQEQPPVSFQHILQCSEPCLLTFHADYQGFLDWPPVTQSFTATGVLTTTTLSEDFHQGDWVLTWTFTKYASTPAARNDLVKIFNITVASASNGGAPLCAPCPGGSISSASSQVCTPCLPGQQSNQSITCVPCTGNTFSFNAGDVCIPCGQGTVPTADHSDCINTCAFSLLDSTNTNVTYDFSPLSANNLILGPLDDSEYVYTFNFCGRGGFDYSTCHDQNYNFISGHVCQYDIYGMWSIDLGEFPGYYLTDNGTVLVSFTGGTVGCGPKLGTPVARTTYIELICDLNAGLGTIIPSPLGTERPACSYHFELRSIYACHICSSADYDFYYTPCSNGGRLKVYYWKETPPQCRNGVSLPVAEQVPCSGSTLVCPPGQHLDDNAGTEVCKDCLAGQYSVGGGQAINSWQTSGNGGQLPIPFTTFCVGVACVGWTPADTYIQSGIEESSLLATYNFVQVGSISFQYKVFSPVAGVFEFIIDGNSVIKTTAGVSSLTWTSFASDPLTVGTHNFIWKFSHGNYGPPSTLTLEHVILFQVSVFGLDFHDDECVPCPAGTYSGAVATGCLPCGLNSVSGPNSPSCDPCSNGTFSLGGIGAASCISKVPCSYNDYYKSYSACVNNTANVTYVPLDPHICDETLWSPPDLVTEVCGGCPAGLFWSDDSSTCVSCPATQYYDAPTSTCVDAAVGYSNIKREYYFVPFYTAGATSQSSRRQITASAWPAGFTTGCSGACGTAGWRVLSNGVDSGFQSSNVVDSWLQLSTQFETDGSVSFTYQILGDSGVFTGLQLLVDGAAVPIEIPFTGGLVNVTVPIPAGAHTIVWNFHQAAGDASIAQVRNLIVTGSQTGAATATPCPAGTANGNAGSAVCTPCSPGFSSAQASPFCTPCAPGTYANQPASPVCTPCPAGTQAANNQTINCETSCKFSSGTTTFDLSSLSDVVGPVHDTLGQSFFFSFCNVGALNSSCPASRICYKQGDAVYSSGVTLSFIPNQNVSGAEFFTLRYYDGDSTLCENPNNKSSAIFSFECSVEITELDPLPRFIDADSDSCTSYFAWRTPLACPVCKDSDYVLVEGPCESGSKTITKSRKSVCNGKASITQSSQSCTAPPADVNVAGVIIPVVAFVVLLVVAIVLYIRYRKLTTHYSRLLSDREMSPRGSVSLPEGSAAVNS